MNIKEVENAIRIIEDDKIRVALLDMLELVAGISASSVIDEKRIDSLNDRIESMKNEKS